MEKVEHSMCNNGRIHPLKQSDSVFWLAVKVKLLASWFDLKKGMVICLFLLHNCMYKTTVGVV